MANATINLPITQFAYVDHDTPYTPITPSTSMEYRVSYRSGYRYKCMYCRRPDMPSNIKHASIVGFTITLAQKIEANGRHVDVIMCDDFDPSTVTYENQPDYRYDLDLGFPSAVADGVLRNTTSEYRNNYLMYFLGYKGMLLFHGEDTTYAENTRRTFIKTVLTNGSTRPYLTITYDNAAKAHSKISYDSSQLSGTINSAAARTLNWSLVKDDATSPGNYFSESNVWAQTSAVFRYRVRGTSTWTTKSISGNTKSITLPAYTFKTGTNYEYQIVVTDDDGTTSQTDVLTFITALPMITPSSYPSGSGIDNRNAITFTWRFASSAGDVDQQSATMYWRVQGASAWNSVTASGSTQSVTIPGYTFPSNSTIEWYLYGTDITGTSSQSQVDAFMTAVPTLTPTDFPTGSGVDTRKAFTFTWTLASTAGPYNQIRATLYWKKSGDAEWNTISVASASKSICVPANTFSTGASIQWYIEAVDASGAPTSGAQRSFTTVSTKITAESYPSGNAVDFGSALRFSWIFKSSVGNHEQTSASLFWRAATEDPWTEIQASGTVQSLTVPAYTFPSASTIQWYLSGTDIGGLESTSSTMSFKTVSPKITPQNSPTSGYADPRNAITFSWFFSTGSSNYPQQSADFYWRVAGAETWNHVAASGSTQSVTIPANTFPLLSDIEWRLTGTDIGGTFSETEIYTFSTTASTAYAVCQEPVGRAEDGTKEITLRWIVRNEDGSVATRTILKWKLPTESQFQWHELIDTTESITEYTVEAGFFDAGPVEWLVIAYNRDSVAGPESKASFVCVTAPDAPKGLAATAVPLTTISWQSIGQEAYEVSIDGEVVAESFGSSIYSYQVKEPLADGAHTIRVRVQGAYGLWSDYAETQILVENEAHGTLDLSGTFEVDGELIWVFSEEDEPVTTAIYRDGVWIGTATGATNFLDRHVLGKHEYRVEYWFEDGNYTRSETITGTMACGTLKIAEVRGGTWLDLKLSENQSRAQMFRRSLMATRRHITALRYPIVELSTYEDLTGSFDCAFADQAGARRFEALFGKTVILKTPVGEVIMGAITEIEKKATEFYVTYTFDVLQSYVEDFVRHDSNS